MNELALFAGAGGGMLGTHHLGIKPVCAVERELHRRCVLAQRQNDGLIPPFPIWDDVKTFDARPWRGIIDFVSGGFPCQAFSTAARGRNNAEDLWPEMLRIVADVAARYVYAENVSATAINTAAEDLETLGYQTRVLSLSAADVGADHIRERYWLLAYTDDKSELRRVVNAKVAVSTGICGGLWSSDPGIARMADGLAPRMERYAATGNGQVPAVAAAALWALANTD